MIWLSIILKSFPRGNFIRMKGPIYMCLRRKNCPDLHNHAVATALSTDQEITQLIRSVLGLHE